MNEQYTKQNYTKGHKLLGTKIIDFCDLNLKAEIYKSKTRNSDKTRFLVWFPDYNFCAMVWKDYKINMNDVGKSPDGKNWYSYANSETLKMLNSTSTKFMDYQKYSIEYDSAILYYLAEQLFASHNKLVRKEIS